MNQEEDIPLDPSTLIRLGRITEVTFDPPRCKVRFSVEAEEGEDDADENGETPPIRWLAARAGSTRVWSPPGVGEEVVLLSPDGQIGNAVALCGLYNGEITPPGSTLAELVEFEDGAQIGYDPEAHALTAILPAGATALIEAPGGLTIRGNLTVDGIITATGDVTGADVSAGGISLKSHKHTGVAAGGAQTGTPI